MWAGVGCAAAAIPVLLVIETLNEREHVAAVLAKRNAAAINLALARPSSPEPLGIRSDTASFERALASGGSIRTGSLSDRPARRWSHPSDIATAGPDTAATGADAAAGQLNNQPAPGQPDEMSTLAAPMSPLEPFAGAPQPAAPAGLSDPQLQPLLTQADPVPLIGEPELPAPLPEVLMAAAQPPAAESPITVVAARENMQGGTEEAKEPISASAARSGGSEETKELVSAPAGPTGRGDVSNPAPSEAQVAEFASDRVEMPPLPPKRVIAKSKASKRIAKQKPVAPLNLMKWSLP